jgi:hypothetical protein
MALANIEKVAKHVIQKCMLNLISWPWWETYRL